MIQASRWVERGARNLRLALRALARRPGFTATALLTLGLGIGVSVSVFGVANLALFRALPFPDADRLVLGRTQWPDGDIGTTVSAPDYYDVRDQSTSFESLAAITPFTWEVTVTGRGEPERLSAAWISPGLFGTLGVTPAFGREFLPEEGEPGAAPVVILSHDLWERRFGGVPPTSDTEILLNGEAVSVVGVIPAGFAFINEADLWLPMVRGEGWAAARQFHNWLAVGRLREDVRLGEARAEVDVIMRQLAAAYPGSNADKGMVIADMQETVVEDFRPSLLLLMGAILLVLLIACGNIAGLLLARGASRRTELAIRSALGAKRGQLIRELLSESLVLALGAGLLGTPVAVALQRWAVRATPLTRVGLQHAGVQPEVLGFALLLSLATVAVFGLAPALVASRLNLSEDLKSGSRTVATSVSPRLRSVLVISQVALSVLLLVGAALLLRSFVELRTVDPGFEPERLLTAEIGLPPVRYESPERRQTFFRELVDRVEAIPGVGSVGLVSRLPIRDFGGNTAAWDPSDPPADAAEARLAYTRTVTPGYFETMRIPLRSGRDVRPTDVDGAAPVTVISETTARTIFSTESALGRQVAVDLGGEEPAVFEVVGVVGDVRIENLGSGPSMAMYFSYAQRSALTMKIAVRTAGDPTAIVRPLREELRRVDSEVPLADPRTMEAVISDSVSFTRTVMAALAFSAGFALFLAGLGLYALLSFFVAQRRHEIGVRLALGAQGADVYRLVLGRGLSLVVPGVAIGAIAALGAACLVEDILFQVRATDPVAFGAAPAFFLLVALVACLAPAWRASHVDPLTTLRSE